MTTRIVLVGGFLGAGKTTLLLRAAQRLAERGYRVGLVTNDQGEDLVDTALGEAAAVPVVEVAGGCFCCRFPDLLTNLRHLQDAVDPHVILAEPVGSCTDLVATVLRPLVQFYGDAYTLAPLSVLLDSSRGLDGFSPQVTYLYQQQLAEAELILLSKRDLLTPSECRAQQAAQQAAHPRARVLPISAKRGDGIDTWLDVVLGQRSANPDALTIDYERYAAAEAALGWLNAKGQVRANAPYSPRQWTADLLTGLDALTTQQGCAIAHIKTMVTAMPPTPSNGESARHADAAGTMNAHGNQLKASLTQAASTISWDVDDIAPETRGHEFVLNARVHATPEQLEMLTMQAIEQAKPHPSARYYLEHFECFSPLPPQPHHRL